MIGEFDDDSGEYCKRINEHYFLTDPEEFSLSHFPTMENDPDYSRCQLLEELMTLEQFNCSPHLSSSFFDLGLELVDDIPTPWGLQDRGVIKIKAWEAIRYKVCFRDI